MKTCSQCGVRKKNKHFKFNSHYSNGNMCGSISSICGQCKQDNKLTDKHYAK